MVNVPRLPDVLSVGPVVEKGIFSSIILIPLVPDILVVTGCNDTDAPFPELVMEPIVVDGGFAEKSATTVIVIEPRT
jgi:hypothetical protein